MPDAHDDYHPVAAKALVAEDEPEEGFLLEQLLKSNGVQVTLVRTVADALENIRRGRFHLAFVDLRLEDGSGLEVLKAINDGSRMTMPIVITGDPGDLIEAILASGAYLGVVMKPYSLHLIRRILVMHRLPVSN